MVSFLSVIVDSLFYSQCLSKLLGVSGSSFEYQVSLLPLLLFLYFFLLNPSLQYIAKGKKRRKNLLRNWSVVSSWVPSKNYQEDLLGIYFYPSFSTPSFSARFEFFVCSFRFCVALFLRPKTKLLPFPVFLFHSTLSAWRSLEGQRQRWTTYKTRQIDPHLPCDCPGLLRNKWWQPLCPRRRWH